MSIVCLGEALVDLIRRPADPENRPSTERFDTYFGGALANVAVAVARAGSGVALAGACGEDEFGRLLRNRLETEGVDLSLHETREALTTPFAFIRTGPDGEPSFQIHGDGIEAGIATLAGREPEMVAAASAVVIGSNTLVAERGRTVTLALVAEARRGGVPVLFDPNLRLRRWPSTATALAACRDLIPQCRLVKTNLAEARMLCAGAELEAAEAAAGLAELGAEIAVVTAGAGGVVARGGGEAEVLAERIEDPQPLGAGDALMGTLAAAMEQRDWRAGAIAEALELGVAAGAAACRHAGAID